MSKILSGFSRFSFIFDVSCRRLNEVFCVESSEAFFNCNSESFVFTYFCWLILRWLSLISSKSVGTTLSMGRILRAYRNSYGRSFSISRNFSITVNGSSVVLATIKPRILVFAACASESPNSSLSKI